MILGREPIKTEIGWITACPLPAIGRDRPPSSPSSLVEAGREWGVTSMYLPKTSITFEPPTPNTRRYLPPTRTSISQESRDMPIDFGTPQRLNSSGLVHASNTMRAGPLKV